MRAQCYAWRQVCTLSITTTHDSACMHMHGNKYYGKNMNMSDTTRLDFQMSHITNSKVSDYLAFTEGQVIYK